MIYFLFHSLPRYAMRILIYDLRSLRVGTPHPLRSRRLMCWPVSPTWEDLTRGSPHLLYFTPDPAFDWLARPLIGTRFAQRQLFERPAHLPRLSLSARKNAHFFSSYSPGGGGAEPPRYLNRPFSIDSGRLSSKA